MLHAYETGISSAHLGLWLVYAFTFLYEQCVGSLMSHRIYMCKGCEMGPMVYHPHPRRLESLTVCRCHYKGSTFSSVIWRPWLLVQPKFEPMTSRSADGRLSHWANWAAGRVQSFFKMIGTSDDDKYQCGSQQTVMSLLHKSLFFKPPNQLGIMAVLDPKTTTWLEVANIPVKTSACAGDRN